MSAVPDTRHGVILYLEDVEVSFDGYRALDGLNLAIDNGELRCIIGPNGAGKTTMMDVITGRTRPDRGRVYLGQQHDLLRHREPGIARLGIGRKFQKPTVFEALSARDNLKLALRRPRGVWAALRHRLSPQERSRIESLLERVGLLDCADAPADRLSHGQKQWLELGMLLAQDPRLLLLDEPVAGMTAEEREKTARLLVDLAGEHSIVLVEHDMEFLRALARRVTVLHEGRVLAEGSLAQMQSHPEVRRVYLGERATVSPAASGNADGSC